MQEKALWNWTYSGPKGEFSGSVAAVDPRDALSRALTSETPSGLLFGEEHRIPITVLYDAPGNFDTQYTAKGEGFSLRLQRTIDSD